MNIRERVVLQTLLTICCCSNTSAHESSFSLEGRDPGVKRWISYEIIGPSNHPYPIVYLSTRSFKTTRNEFLTVLPKGKYDVISGYTKSRISQDDCPGSDPRSNYIWYTVKVSQRDRTSVQSCTLPQKVACVYLNAVVNLVRARWTLEELRPVMIFMSEIKCDVDAEHSEAGSDSH